MRDSNQDAQLASVNGKSSHESIPDQHVIKLNLITFIHLKRRLRLFN
jgi:hypothetical protein